MTEKMMLALDKISKGQAAKLDRYGEAMKKDVADALREFVQQDEEFAQAVVEGGTFEECMKDIAGHIKGGSISDMEAFGAAVRFFFPGAKIRVEMTIDLIGDAAKPEPPKAEPQTGGVVIDLSDFF